MKKILSLIFCCLIFVFIPISVFASVSADEAALSSRYINVVDASTTFKISNTGEATVRDSYSGKVGSLKVQLFQQKFRKKLVLFGLL